MKLIIEILESLFMTIFTAVVLTFLTIILLVFYASARALLGLANL